MAATYDDYVKFMPHDDVVFDWLDCGSGKRVRVQATRKTVTDKWGIDWNNRDKVIEEFNRRKEQHKVEACNVPGNKYEIE
jgi:hypothetical protein